MDSRPWIAFFSQTGSEIANLIQRLGKYPDLIVTNKRPSKLRRIHADVPPAITKTLPNKPSVRDIARTLAFYDNPIVTLHGWLRIMPPTICEKYEIYNGHPGLITEYPELKGKDPQEKAFKLGHKKIGSVIHKVTAGVDEGEVLMHKSITAKTTLDMTYKGLASTSLNLWIDFLRKKL